MHSAAAERLEFAPPRDKGSLRALALALLVHILLIAALTWGVSWKRSDDSASFEAELWSGAAQQATPPVLETPAQPQPPNAAAARVEPTPPTPVPAATPPQPAPVLPSARAPAAAPPVQPDVDIALENEKKRQLAQQQKEAEQQKAQKLQEKREAELQARQTQESQKKKERELKAREELAERKAAEQAEKAAEEKRKLAAAAEKQKKAAAENQKQATAAANAAAAAEKQKLAAAAKEKQAAASAAAEKQKQAAAASEKKHQEEVKRMLAMANAAAGGGSTAEGAGSAKASGPSAGYAGKVKARVLPNVIFTDDIVGNPKAEVEVRTTPDGTIMSQRLVKSSGNKAWDDAVLKAIVRTGSLPRDIDGRVPTPMILEFRPY